jgi:dTDP-4-amino-4,6-dideoxygalactose transaminase
MIPFADPGAQVTELRGDIDRAIATVLYRGRYVLGEEVRQFEAEFAAYLGTGWSAGVGNGTDALHIALRALGIGAGDEVIIPSMSATATGTAVVQSGATPVFADIDAVHHTIDPEALRRLVTPRTRAVIAVHLYGQACDLEALVALCGEHGVHLIEDCAQSHGARYHGRRVGTFGVLSCFSFYPTKNLGAIGDGGAVAGSDPALQERVRLLREYGWRERYHSSHEGWNSRLDELQAAILRVKLPHLDADNGRRRAIAARYLERLSGTSLVLPTQRPDSEHVFHLFAVQSPDRDALAARLAARGVGTLVHYPLGIHQQQAFAPFAVGRALPVTEQLARQELSLPMFPQLSEADVETVCRVLLTLEPSI